MSKTYVLVVGVETCRDPEISRFEYAEADARALAAVWPADEVQVLVNDEATKTLVESRLRKLSREKAEGDALILIYFGHAFSFEGENYLCCSDTLAEDLDLTSLPLRGLIERGGIDLLCMDSARFPLGDELLTSEIECGALLASAPGELSYVAPLFAHGIWTHHLLAALQKPEALTGEGVQEMLLKSVPATLRKTFNDEVTRAQTPMLLGDAAERVITSGEGGSEGPAAGAGTLTHVVMSGVTAGKIKQLSGFNKQWHKVPDEINDYNSKLVESLGAEEVDGHAEQLFQDLKAAFKYKRREISCSSADGCASIQGADFDVDINICIDPDDLSGYLIETAVRRFRSPEVVQSDAFKEVFSNAFNVLRFDFSKAFDIEDIVDTIEDLEDEAVQVSYPPDCSTCVITTTAFAGEIVFDGEGFRVQLDRRGPPEELIGSFVSAQELLGADRLLPG